MTIATILAQAEGSPWASQLFLLGGLMLIMYFFMIRPQMKRAKEAKKFRENLNIGTKVVTIGGIHGKILELADTTVLISVDSGKMRVEKSAISPDSSSSEQELTQRSK